LPRSTLTQLQQDLLDAFFRREQRFFLTGGAALAGFFLGHRSTHDLDLFATTDVLDAGDVSLREAARELQAMIENVQTSPTFRRRLVRRGAEAVIVDLVFAETPQDTSPKQLFGGIRVDPPGEIVANKICALLSRAELRDLVDLRALEGAGYRIEDALELARRKDAGVTPGQLAWVLKQIQIGEDAVVPGVNRSQN
jgi:Nucleotidyl transferase AbiEii toxin, Type IV TA system